MEKDPDKNPEGNFLARWSRRKVKTAQRPGVVDAIGVPHSDGLLIDGQRNDKSISVRHSAGEDAEPGAPTAKEILTDEQMPPLNSLTEDSDFSPFLSPGVSEGLRKQALRQLFGSPGFNIRDGLDDYDDDFRNFAALGDLITSDMKHQMELEEERQQKAREQAEQAKAEPAAVEDADGETPATHPADQDTNGDGPPDGDEVLDGEPDSGTPTDQKSS